MARYKGYSSNNYEKNGSFLLTDVALVKEDFLNHLFTRKGERPRMPNYGTIIPDLIFENINEGLLEVLYDQILGVIRAEPRFRLLDLQVIPSLEEYSVTVNIAVQYVEINMTENINFNIQFAEG